VSPATVLDTVSFFHPLRTIVSVLLTLFFPHCCCLCKKPFTPLCESCADKLDFCTQFETKIFYPNNKLQAVCRFDRNSQKIIHTFKYQNIKDLAFSIAKLIVLHVPLPPTDFVTSVPPDPLRKKQRGFDHTQLIAQTIAQYLDTPYIECFTKKEQTQAQAKTRSKAEREQNIKNAFSITTSFITTDILNGSSILLVDDVCTTGTTLQYCNALLEECGFTTSNVVFAVKI